MKTEEIKRDDGQIVKEYHVTCFEAIWGAVVLLLLFAFLVAVLVTVVQGG